MDSYVPRPPAPPIERGPQRRPSVFSMSAILSLLRNNPFSVVISCVLASVCSVMVYSAVESWLYNESPVKVSDVVLSADGHWLSVGQMQDVRCSINMAYLLYPEKEPQGAIRTYYTLGYSQNGLPYPGSVPRYTVNLQVPPELRGDFFYIERGEALCPPWAQYSYTSTPPLLLHLGP
jgi:hypothetical protein